VPGCAQFRAGCRGVCLLTLLLCAWSGFSVAKERDSGPHPAMRIPTEPLGYRVQGKLYLLARYTTSSLDFLDESHLLFTFRRPRLLKREEGSGGLEQVVQADVIEIPAGKVVAEEQWLLRDRGRYLWRIGDHHALLRIGSSLYQIGTDLHPEQVYRSPTPLRMVEASSDGKLLLLESEHERHTPEQHRQLALHAQLVGADPPEEDVEIRMARLDEKKLLMSARADQAGDLPATVAGYFTQQKVKDTLWNVYFHPFERPQSNSGDLVTAVDSSCDPSQKVMSEQTVLILSCPPKRGDRFVAAYSLDGHKLWDGRWQSNFTWPAFRVAEGGATVAISWLAVNRPVTPTEGINDEEVQSQVLTVLDAHTGALRMGMVVNPIVSAGGNFALSADGNRLAVVNRGAIEVYDLPPPAPPADGKPAK
jgi:hypothetical protein